MDAAEDNGRASHPRGDTGELQAIAGEIGELLDFAILVVVSEDGGVFAGLEGLNLLDQIGHEGFPCFLTVAEEQPTVFGTRSRQCSALPGESRRSPVGPEGTFSSRALLQCRADARIKPGGPSAVPPR